jgi:hypothetical protein
MRLERRLRGRTGGGGATRPASQPFSGKYELTENRTGLVAILNDLHKGRDSGKPWGVAIDISALLLTLVSLTGLILIFFLFKRRTSGLLVLAAGALLCYPEYAIWVP